MLPTKHTYMLPTQEKEYLLITGSGKPPQLEEKLQEEKSLMKSCHLLRTPLGIHADSKFGASLAT